MNFTAYNLFQTTNFIVLRCILSFSVFAGCMCWTSGVCAWVRHSSGNRSIKRSGQIIQQQKRENVYTCIGRNVNIRK